MHLYLIDCQRGYRGRAQYGARVDVYISGITGMHNTAFIQKVHMSAGVDLRTYCPALVVATW